MAIANRIGSILIEGIERVACFAKKAPYGLEGELNEIIDFSLEDSQEKADMRAGFQAPIVYTKYGNRTILINLTNGTLSTSLLKLMSGSSSVVKTSTMPKREMGVVISSNTATLASTPAVGQPISVYVADAYGRNGTRLTPVASNPQITEYSINGSGVITVNSGVTGKLNVYYNVTQELEEISGVGGVLGTYKLEIACVWHDITTNLKYNGVIEVDNATISPSYTIAGKNSNDVPDAQSIEFTVLTTLGQEPYRIKFAERV